MIKLEGDKWREELKSEMPYKQSGRKGMTKYLKMDTEKKPNRTLFSNIPILSIHIKHRSWDKSYPYIFWSLLYVYIILFNEC